MKLIIFKKTIVKEYYYLIENYFYQEKGRRLMYFLINYLELNYVNTRLKISLILQTAFINQFQ